MENRLCWKWRLTVLILFSICFSWSRLEYASNGILARLDGDEAATATLALRHSVALSFSSDYFGLSLGGDAVLANLLGLVFLVTGPRIIGLRLLMLSLSLLLTLIIFFTLERHFGWFSAISFLLFSIFSFPSQIFFNLYLHRMPLLLIIVALLNLCVCELIGKQTFSGSLIFAASFLAGFAVYLDPASILPAATSITILIYIILTKKSNNHIFKILCIGFLAGFSPAILNRWKGCPGTVSFLLSLAKPSLSPENISERLYNFFIILRLALWPADCFLLRNLLACILLLSLIILFSSALRGLLSSQNRPGGLKQLVFTGYPVLFFLLFVFVIKIPEDRKYFAPVVFFLNTNVAILAGRFFEFGTVRKRWNWLAAAVMLPAVILLGGVLPVFSHGFFEKKVTGDIDIMPRIASFIDSKGADALYAPFFVKWQLLFHLQDRIPASTDIFGGDFHDRNRENEDYRNKLLMARKPVLVVPLNSPDYPPQYYRELETSVSEFMARVEKYCMEDTGGYRIYYDIIWKKGMSPYEREEAKKDR